MRLARPVVVAVALLAVSVPPGCRRAPQTKVEKLAAREQQLQTRVDKLRERQRQIEASLTELEDRLAQTRSELERERARFDEGTPTHRRGRRTPTPPTPG